MATDLAAASRDALEKFELHGIRTRNYFLNIRNSNPAAGVLSTPDTFKARVEEIQRSFEEAHRAKSSTRYVAAILQGERELFTQCSAHLRDCLGELAASAHKNFKRYKRICRARPHYYMSGAYPSPAAIRDEFAALYRPLTNALDREFVDIKTGTAGWNEHFECYYAAIEWYQSCIAKMNALFDEDKKKWVDRTGIHLRWVSIGIAVLTFLAGYFLGRT